MSTVYDTGTARPVKRRDIHNHHFDSTVWESFEFRDDDIVIASYAKSGTTWTQQIVGQILSGGDSTLPVAELSPWVDLRFPPAPEKLSSLEAQTGRRFVKTHLPVDALVFSPQAKYIYIARDGRDVVWSLFNHHASANEKWYSLLNDTPGLIGPPMPRPGTCPISYFREWLDNDGYPFWPYWENIRTWWSIRNLENVKMIHFSDLLNDFDKQLSEIAAFIGVEVPTSQVPKIRRNCSFSWMKQHGDKCAPLNGELWKDGAQSFIHRGRNGRWRDQLPREDSLRYEAIAKIELGLEAAAWLSGDMNSEEKQDMQFTAA